MAILSQSKIYIPIATITLVGVTFFTSIIVSWLSSGSFFGSVHSSELLHYGAVNYQNLLQGGWWRLFVCQLLHVHFTHMIFNIVMLLILGCYVERIIGSLWFVILYIASGIVGILMSVILVPNLINSGASQALMGVVGTALILLFKKRLLASWQLILALGVTLFLQIMLDLISSHHLKPGHFVGFLVGMIVGIIYILNHRIKSSNQTSF